MARAARTQAAKATPPGVRERILDAAIATLREHGLQKLTQPRVAERARVRQSHLTYYFPTREDLLEAVATRAVEQIAHHGAGATAPAEDQDAMLARLAAVVTDPGHMRMFLGLVVEADEDPAVRALLAKGTHHMEAAVAAALGGDDQSRRARVLLSALWGLGLYRFLIRPSSKDDPTGDFLSLIADLAGATTARKRGRKRDTHAKH